jgi:transposase
MKSRKHIAHIWHIKHEDGMSYEEIAAEYDVSKGAVSGAIWRHVKKTGYQNERKTRNTRGY